jgi:hypothetical protein
MRPLPRGGILFENRGQARWLRALGLLRKKQAAGQLPNIISFARS